MQSPRVCRPRAEINRFAPRPLFTSRAERIAIRIVNPARRGAIAPVRPFPPPHQHPLHAVLDTCGVAPARPPRHPEFAVQLPAPNATRFLIPSSRHRRTRRIFSPNLYRSSTSMLPSWCGRVSSCITTASAPLESGTLEMPRARLLFHSHTLRRNRGHGGRHSQ